MATLGTLRGQVRNLVLERTGDTGLITDTEANEIINIAARVLFLRIASRWGEALAQRSSVNLAVSASGVVPLASLSPTTAVVRVLDARVGTTGAADTALRVVRPFNKAQERWVYEGTSPLPFRYYIEGVNLVFVPPALATYDARFVWVQMPADMSADGTSAWDGKLPEHHDTIAVLASIMVLNKDGNPQAPFAPAFEYIEKVMTDRFGPPGPYDVAGRENGRP